MIYDYSRFLLKIAEDRYVSRTQNTMSAARSNVTLLEALSIVA